MLSKYRARVWRPAKTNKKEKSHRTNRGCAIASLAYDHLRSILDLTKKVPVVGLLSLRIDQHGRNPDASLINIDVIHYSQTKRYAWQGGIFTYSYFVHENLPKGKCSIASRVSVHLHLFHNHTTSDGPKTWFSSPSSSSIY